MWQRFSEMARKAVFYAQEEAQNLGEGYVSTEHLLLGILRDNGSTGSQILIKAGIDPSNVRHEVLEHLPKGDARPSQDMTLTPRAKRVIDIAYDEARQFGHNYIGTEHLLLGLIREGDGLAGRVLAKLGMELEPARAICLELLGGESVPATPARSAYREPGGTSKALTLLFARMQRMVVDQMCLIFLHERSGAAASAIAGVGKDPTMIANIIEEDFLSTLQPDDVAKPQICPSDFLAMASQQASSLRQDLNGSHILLAALQHGNCATLRACASQNITYEDLRTWIEQNL